MSVTILTIFCAVLAGILIGVGFFAGLWWTVQRASSSRQPGVLFAGSFLLRTGLALGIFYLVGGASWSRMAACLVGFIVGRMLVRRFCDADNLPAEGRPLKGGAQ